MLELAAIFLLASRCAPTVAPQTLVPLTYVESRFDPLAIGVNGGLDFKQRPVDTAQAVRVAKRLISAGGSIDLGLGQINSRNLHWLGLSVEDSFEPCANLNAAARVLAHNYRAATKGEADPQRALRAALSIYNTGDPRRGIRSGYVARVETAARELSPAIDALMGPQAAPSSKRPSAAEPPASADAAESDVFLRPPTAALIFQSAASGADGPSFKGDPR